MGHRLPVTALALSALGLDDDHYTYTYTWFREVSRQRIDRMF